jgi:hypothetical protein
MKPRILLITSGSLLMIGVAMSWATLTSEFVGFSRRIMALGSDELLLAAGGLILLLIGMFGKNRPGKIYSDSGLIISILCGFIAYKLLVATFPAEGGASTSLGLGLGCLRPVASFLGLLGSLMRTSVALVVSVEPTETIPQLYSERVQPK